MQSNTSQQTQPSKRLIKNISLLLMLAVALLACLSIEVIYQAHWLVQLNHCVNHCMHAISTPGLTCFFATVTQFGLKIGLIPAAMLLCAYLFWRGNTTEAMHYLTTILIAIIIAYTMKNLIYSPRPIALFLPNIKPHSFPSGHSSLTTAIYGFYLLLIWPQLTTTMRKCLGLIAVVCICLLVYSARLYLHMHWLTDIFAGMLVGVISISAVALSYLSSNTRKPIALKPFFGVSLGILICMMSLNIYLGYGKAIDKHGIYKAGISAAAKQNK